MAKAKKTKKEEIVEPIGEVIMPPAEKLEQCEWVFQFDDDEPQIFAWTNEDMADEDPTVTFTMRPRNFPGSAYGTSPAKNVITTDVTTYTNKVFMRARARQMAMEISSADIGVQWQLGSPRIDGRPDGKR